MIIYVHPERLFPFPVVTLTHDVVDRSYGHHERADQPIGHGQRCHEVIRYRAKSPGRENGEYDQRVANLVKQQIKSNAFKAW